MKNMKKLLRKAMVFTLTAAMLVGTPLTASAAGLVDLYQSEDALANTNSDQETGTGTGTGTGSKGLNELPADLLGIYLDSTNLEVEHPQEGSLTVAFEWSAGKAPETADQKKMLENIKWESSNPEVIAVGKTSIDEGSNTNTVALAPKLPGTATVTASLTSKDGKSFSAYADVTVIRYADKLTFKETELKDEACTGNTINLNDYVNRIVIDDGVETIANTSDTLAFSLKTEVNKSATLKNGVLALKKEGKIKILAVGQKKGEKVGTGWLELDVQPGTNVKKITFKDGNKTEIKVNDALTKQVTALIEKDGDGVCKNRITWTSKKPAIVEIEGAAANLPLDKSNTATPESTVTLKAKAPGKAQIEAKASNGKKATLTVTVSANLTKIEISNAPKTAYSGQTIDLYDTAVQHFGKTRGATGNPGFTDAGLKWSFADSDSKKAAKISAKGVLSIKPDIKGVKSIQVTAKSAKKVDGQFVEADKAVTIDLKQVSITEITVTRTNIGKAATAKNDGKKIKSVKGKDTIDVGEVVYTLTAAGTYDDNGTEKPLSDDEAKAALGWTASGKVVKASKNADNNGVVTAIKKGSATITINAATKNKKNKYVAIKTALNEKVNAPSKTLTLSLKNKGIAVKKNQTITIKPILDKGSTTKNDDKDIVWTATLKKNNGTLAATQPTISKGKLKLTKNNYEAGDLVTVTARIKNGGPSATITLPIVKSGAVKFSKGKVTLAMKPDDENKTEFNETVTVTVGNGTPGKENVSPVTYTVNKPGIVRIKDLGNGQLQINAVSNGTVKITATTLDGKKKAMTVKVSNVTYAATFWKQK